MKLIFLIIPLTLFSNPLSDINKYQSDITNYYKDENSILLKNIAVNKEITKHKYNFIFLFYKRNLLIKNENSISALKEIK